MASRVTLSMFAPGESVVQRHSFDLADVFVHKSGAHILEYVPDNARSQIRLVPRQLQFVYAAINSEMTMHKEMLSS